MRADRTPFNRFPPEQEAIRAKCFHPSGQFEEFSYEDIEKSIPERFEKIVQRYPDRIAVRTSDQTLTYRELNKRANRLAHEILATRGDAQEPVALFFDHWAPLIIAHLAVLKAGKISLALDPRAEKSRTAHMLADSGAALILCDQGTTVAAQEWVASERDIIDIDGPNPVYEENPKVHIPADAYAYIRYTSGSTGSAKGATKTHRHVVKGVMDFTNHFHICAEDRVTLLGFGSIGKHLFEALLNGARLCPFDPRKEGVVLLSDWLTQEKITLYYSFPTVFRHFVSILSGEEDFSNLRLIEMEGEPVYQSDLDLYKKHFPPHCLLVNTLSSAETGTVCLYFVDRNTTFASGRAPVGYPVDDMEVLILDEDGEPVESNQIGEVAVRSRFLSSKYWSKSEPAPFPCISDTAKEPAPIYYTRDLGRLSEDGCLELLGRKDFQIKIRSFRVDVTEVETALALHPEVKEACAAGVNDQSGNVRLVAYVVPREHPGPSVVALKSFLQEKLPESMIPSVFVFLDALPVMSTGKVDRRLLPAPGRSRPDLQVAYVAPRSPVETILSRIWAQVLALDTIGVQDNFFDLGGHSLAATQIVSRVIKRFQLELPLQSLFAAPTVAEMGAVIEKHDGYKVDEARVSCILAEVESLSDEEARRLLTKESAPAGARGRHE
jgi:non-ribosomal peptide synthetase component F/acyl carrier protein